MRHAESERGSEADENTASDFAAGQGGEVLRTDFHSDKRKIFPLPAAPGVDAAGSGEKANQLSSSMQSKPIDGPVQVPELPLMTFTVIVLVPETKALAGTA